jgi:hypothetical protein
LGAIKHPVFCRPVGVANGQAILGLRYRLRSRLCTMHGRAIAQHA